MGFDAARAVSHERVLLFKTPSDVRILSVEGRPLPPLVKHASTLAPDVLGNLDSRNVPDLPSYVTGKTLNILLLIGRIAEEQAKADDQAMGGNVFRQRVLGDMFQLMVALSALGDVLKLAGRVLPADRIRPHPQKRLADRIDWFLDRTIQIPANEIKHRGFDMGWLTLRSACGITHGYSVSGRVGSKFNAPIKYRAKDRGSPEGYSFAYVLRNSVAILFGICDALDSAFFKSGCYWQTSATDDGPRVEVPVGIESSIEHINALPKRGFFDESGLEVPVLDLRDGTLIATMRRMRTHPLGAKVSFAINNAASEVQYKMPYWKPYS